MKLQRKIIIKIGAVLIGLERWITRLYYHALFHKNVEKVGKGIKISGEIKVVKNTGLIVGSDVFFGRNVEIVCHAGVVIGNGVTIHDGCSIISSYPIFKNKFEPSFLSEIPGSINIGEGSVIGACSTILCGIDIPPNTIVPPYSKITQSEEFIRKTTVKVSEIKPMNFETISVMNKYSNFPDEVVFVLSTGRSGSNSIETLANENKNVNAFHEPFYAQLKILSLEFCTGLISENEARLRLLNIYSNAPITRNDKIYLESDQKLVPFIKILASIFPQAKFIWLIRSPQSFLNSAKARGWFLNDHPVIFNNKVLITPQLMSDGCRITGDLVGDFSVEDWFSLSQEDKIIWYWKYWNSLIESQLSLISNQRLQLKLEELNGKTETFFHFIGGEFCPRWKPKVKNKIKKKHMNDYSNSNSNNLSYYNLNELMVEYSSLSAKYI